jgi:hypothetical protein
MPFQKIVELKRERRVRLNCMVTMVELMRLHSTNQYFPNDFLAEEIMACWKTIPP